MEDCAYDMEWLLLNVLVVLMGASKDLQGHLDRLFHMTTHIYSIHKMNFIVSE